MKNPQKPVVEKFKNIGKEPYDALITADGRYYIAGCSAKAGWLCWIYGTPAAA